MGRGPSELLPILRSTTQGDMLAMLYLNPDRSYSLTEIARETGVSVKTIHNEANRLVESGFADESRVGQARLLRAPAAAPLVNALTELLLLSYGPAPVLRRHLRDIPGIDRAFIYGSWAARHEGFAGRLPNDVDVAVIGVTDLDVLHEVASAAERELRRPVDIRRLSVAAWDNPDLSNPFVASLKDRPRVDLIGRGSDDQPLE